jgi:hypothetical protein
MELSPIVLIIWGELTLLMAGGLVLLLISKVMSKNKDKKSVTKLMAKIRADREARKMDIRKGLAAYGLKDDALEAKVSEIDKRELKLYHRIATMYQNRSDAMLASMNVAVETTMKPYFELDMQLRAADDEAAESAEATGTINSGEIEALQKQNEELQSELAVTMETIGRMLSEYSSMFSSKEESGLDKDKIMEAFDVDEDDEANIADEAQENSVEDEGELEVVADLDIEEDDAEVVADLDSEEDDLEIVTDLEEESIAEPEIEMADDDLDVDALFESVQQDEEKSEDAAEAAIDDIDDILADAVVPDDELLEIGDDPILTTSLDDKEGEILSELVDLEADFGDSAKTASDDRPPKDQTVETDDLEDLDIDALLEQNKD